MSIEAISLPHVKRNGAKVMKKFAQTRMTGRACVVESVGPITGELKGPVSDL